MIVVEPDWWKTLFDDVYLITDAKFVCNPSLTRQEVKVLEQVLQLRPVDRILDLCGGQGRHALELVRRGYQHLTVLDYTPFLLQLGVSDASREGLSVRFCRGDARAVPFPSAGFDVVLLMANSFGYFVNPADDTQILAEIARVLAPGGRLLLDLHDYDHTRSHFTPESWHEETDDVVVLWRRERHGDVVRVREMVLSKASGLLRDRSYAERLYPPERLRQLLAEADLVSPTFHPNAFVLQVGDGADYGMATHRTVITATRG